VALGNRWVIYLLISVALLYAVFAGLRTVGDTDLGWQLATGRWIVQHHSIPSTDVLSYTAPGKEWIYPALSQVLLYCLFLLGGYSLLSWVGAAACVAIVAILLRRGSFITSVLAVIAVPLIAARTQPRPEMFTELFFAAFVSILWVYHRSGRGPLWLLPVLMFLWVNSHLGFIAGFAMCGAYVVLEAGEVISPKTRLPALHGLRRAAPWLGLTALATLVNPWGWRVYVAIARQNEIMRIHRRWVEEWAPIRINASTFSQLFSWRDARSALLWLLAIAAIAVVIALYRRRPAPAIVLAGAIYAVMHANRFQAPFAALTVIIGGAILAEAAVVFEKKRGISPIAVNYGEAIVTVAVLALVCVRVADLVSNRYYLRTPTTMSLFGPGETILFPERAAQFLQSNNLPANILNDYNSGGYIAWTLYGSYPDYFDGRSIPFGASFFIHLEKLLGESPDSTDWQREADSRGINTVILALDHELAGGSAALYDFCESRNWRPVFLDPYGAVFLRVTPETGSFLQEHQIDCRQASLDVPPAANSSRSQAERFRSLLNAGAVLVALRRDNEALEQLQQAELIFHDNAFLHYAKGNALQGLDRPSEAEAEWLTAFDLGSDEAPHALARLYNKQRRYEDEVRILSQAVRRVARPYGLYVRLGYAQLALNRPENALSSFNRAEEESPYVYEAAELGEGFRTQIAEGRRRAQQLLTQKEAK
jgi:tetratricopeptide (TPR) repeat protein